MRNPQNLQNTDELHRICILQRMGEVISKMPFQVLIFVNFLIIEITELCRSQTAIFKTTPIDSFIFEMVEKNIQCI